MSGKVQPLSELDAFVHDGDTVAVGGAWLCTRPMAAIRQLIRAGRKNLNVVSVLGSIDVDMLVRAGSAGNITFSMVSLESFGLPPNFRHAVERNEVGVTEMTGVSLEVAIEASAKKLPWLPYKGLGLPPVSDLPSRSVSQFATVTCPFSGSEIPVVRALEIDVALIHVRRCDERGNGQLEGTFGIDLDIAAAAKRVILTCEEVVDGETIAASNQLPTIPGFLVSAVIASPFGAHPTSHVPLYGMDGMYLLDYVRGDPHSAEPVSELVCDSEEEYRRRFVAEEKARLLEALPRLSKAI